MKRHQVLIPISREHHQILMLAQLIKRDAPEYRGLPSTFSHKRNYASDKYNNLIKSHLEKDTKLLYPFLSEFQVLKAILNELSNLLDEIDDCFQKISTFNEEDMHMLGIKLEKYVRIKERELFQETQKHLSNDDFARLSALLNQS